jgi:hypothetical protein
MFQHATPGYHQIEDQIAEGDKVVTRLISIGKHEGDLPGAPKTGNDLKTTSITIHRIANGKLVEKWSGKDMMGFLQQVGLCPKCLRTDKRRLRLSSRAAGADRRQVFLETAASHLLTISPSQGCAS